MTQHNSNGVCRTETLDSYKQLMEFTLSKEDVRNTSIIKSMLPDPAIYL